MKNQKEKLITRKLFLQISIKYASALGALIVSNACNQTSLPNYKPQLTTTTTSPSQTPQTAQKKDIVTSAVTESNFSPTVTKSSNPVNAFSEVALVKTNDRVKGIQEAIELLGFITENGISIFLKPNFNSADPYPGSTHLDTLISLIDIFNGMGASEITVGDRSGMGNTRAVMQSLGVINLAKQMQFKIINFDELRMDKWKEIPNTGTHWKEGFLFAIPCLESDILVQTCNLKTHRFGGIFTLSLKNSVGMVAKNHPINGYQYMSELHSSPNQRKMIAEINAVYEPDLVVLDGIKAFTSGGPEKGTLTSPEVILAGTDRIAIDAIGVAILRMYGASFEGPVLQQDQIERAIELNLGINSPDQINIITKDPQSTELAQQIMHTLRAT